MTGGTPGRRTGPRETPWPREHHRPTEHMASGTRSATPHAPLEKSVPPCNPPTAARGAYHTNPMALRTRGGYVNTAEVRRGRDGKSYPATALTREQRNRARRLAHELVCGGGMSIRAAQQVMAEKHGLRRSVGSISGDLRDYECAACADVNE